MSTPPAGGFTGFIVQVHILASVKTSAYTYSFTSIIQTSGQIKTASISFIELHTRFKNNSSKQETKEHRFLVEAGVPC